MKRFAVSTLVLALPLGAQLRFVSPPSAVNVEYSSSSGVTFTNPTTRTQQVDSNLIGSKMTLIRSLSFRRTNIHARTGSTKRTADITIDLGHGVTTATNTFDSNFKANRTNVFKKTKVQLPDWTGATTRPAPFDLEFKFSRPFVYNRTDPLVWDLIVENNTGGGSYYMDWSGASPATTKGEAPVALGKGCTTPNGTFTHTTDYTADATNLSIEMSGTSAPANAPVIAIFGGRDLNANAGLCTNLRADLTFVFVLGVADASGAAKKVLFSVPWSDKLAGISLVSQLAAPNGNTFVLSNGSRATTPFVKGGTPHKIQRIYSNTSKGPTGFGPATSAAPVLYKT